MLSFSCWAGGVCISSEGRGVSSMGEYSSLEGAGVAELKTNSDFITPFWEGERGG